MIFAHGITPFKRQRAGGGAAAWVNDKSILLDGIAETVNIDGVEAEMDGYSTGTISMWVKPVDATPTGTEVFCSFGDTNANAFVYLFITTTGLLRAVGRNTSAVQWNVDTDAAAFSDNTWTHIALVFTGTDQILYVNGSAPAQAHSVTTDKTYWIDAAGIDNGRLGCLNRNSLGDDLFFNGNIDEVVFTSDAKDATAISNIYNSGTPVDESSITNGISYLRIGDNPSDNYNSDVANEWRFYDSIGSNNSDSVNCEEADVEEDTP